MPAKARDQRDGQATRATILATARSQFGNHGFERTTIRSIASAVGVDPALVMHYFGSKAELFAAASRLDIEFPDLAEVAPERVADVLLPMFVAVWGPDGPFLPLLRAAATNKAAADALLAVFVDRVAPALAAVVPDRAAERAALVGSQVLGLATARYILCIPSLADMDDATLIEWLRPVLAHYLTGSFNPVDRP
jgi:AcrR family transcriptional regulator